MRRIDWKDVHDPDWFRLQLQAAPNDGYDPEGRIEELADKALEEWELALAEEAIKMLADDYASKCRLSITLAERYAKLGVSSEAQKFLDYAVALSAQLPRGWEKAQFLNSIAVCLLSLGHVQPAFQIWDQAIQEARSDQDTDPQDTADAGSVLADIAEQLAIAGYTNDAAGVEASIVLPPKKLRATLRMAAIASARRGNVVS